MEDDAATSQVLTRAKIVLRDLEVLLKKNLGHNLTLESFTTSDLMAPGENWGSTMLRVDAVVRRDEKTSEPEELFLVAKMSPQTDFQKKLFNSPSTFRKEIYMLKDIIRVYKDLERECGIPETDVIDLLPKLFGARLSLDEKSGKFDDDAVILMENLKAKNYACGDRKIGCDLTHARMVVITLARFHALGIAVKLKKPEAFEAFKIHAKPACLIDEFFAGSTEFVRSNLKKSPALLPHMDRIEKALLRSDGDSWKLDALAEPWSTICHADFWANNVMFRDDASGHPEDVKFVDFQDYTYLNPMRDLIQFLFTSCGTEVRAAHIEHLCDLYFEKITSHLSRLKCDVNSFSRRSFEERLAQAATLEYSRCMLYTKVVTVDAETDPVHDPSLLFQVESSKECSDRMAEITLRFIHENWI